MNAILVGYRGKVEMLKAIFGSADEPPPTKAKDTSPRVMTPELFRALFG